MPGRFITFEGIEGCGKTTQLGLLRGWMEGAGLPVRATREPGGTALGGDLRHVLLAPRAEEVSPLAELFLYEADRAQHVAQVIRPALEAGENVLCDRFFDSTTAYQAFGRGLPEDWVQELNRRATGGLDPDLTFLFGTPTEEGLRRARGGEGEGGDRLEGESLEFHNRVREGFVEIARREPERFRLIPAGSIDEVHARVLEAVEKEFGWAGDSSKARTRP
ncbi:MAG: dTMP kinase [bacterium]